MIVFLTGCSGNSTFLNWDRDSAPSVPHCEDATIIPNWDHSPEDNNLSNTTNTYHDAALAIENGQGVEVSGNDFTGCGWGVRLKSMDGLTISDGSVPGSDVVLEDSSGLNTCYGTALELTEVTTSTVDTVDLSWTGSGRNGTGLLTQ